MSLSHIPVLKEEILQFLSGKNVLTFCDATLGAGGHAKSVLKAHPEIQNYFAFDQDKNALELAKTKLMDYEEKISYHHKNFRDIPLVLEEEKLPSLDAILFDLGVSSMQIDEKREGFFQRGFSFLREAPLDMRMDQENRLTAEKVVNESPEKELGAIFRELGEEPMWRPIAKAIYESRRKKRIKTTLDLVTIIESVKKRRGRLHPATLVFQALRMFVNEELKALSVLSKLFPYLKVGGLLLVISFHSLEDRQVKQQFRERFLQEKDILLLTKKPLIPTREEMRKNPRSRSAKLRVAEKTEGIM